jgi:hypothetical protein
MPKNDRLGKLARQIEALGRKDEELVQKAHDMAVLRRQAACELHAICAGFVDSVNRLLSVPVVDLGPDRYSPEMFRDPGANLIQINARGRLVQIAFQATEELVSTEVFKIPHILEGEIRKYNQDMLQRREVERQSLFFCLEKDRNTWRFYERGTYRTGLFDTDFLVSVMESLV